MQISQMKLENALDEIPRSLERALKVSQTSLKRVLNKARRSLERNSKAPSRSLERALEEFRRSLERAEIGRSFPAFSKELLLRFGGALKETRRSFQGVSQKLWRSLKYTSLLFLAKFTTSRRKKNLFDYCRVSTILLFTPTDRHSGRGNNYWTSV